MNLINTLIVDDEPHCIEILQIMLEDYSGSIELHSAQDPKTAIDIANQMRIDLLITDLNMPMMNGIYLIDEIHRLWPSCLVIILTAYPDFSTAKEAISRQVYEYITKLDMRNELPKTIEKAICDIRERLQARFISSEAATRFSREAFLCLLQVRALSVFEKKRILSLLGFQEQENTRYVLLLGNQPVPDEMINSLIQENAGANLMMSVSHYQDQQYPVVLMQIHDNVHNTWLFSVLETVQERLRANGYCTSMAVSLVQDYDFPKSFQDVSQSLSRQKTDSDMICVIDSDHEPVIRPSLNYNEVLVRKIIQYVDSHILEDVSLTCLSGVLGYSRAYISTIFHEKTGIPLQQYIIRQKLSHINALMQNKTLSLNRIAEMSGFDSISYFSRFVKRETGMTPREYRLRIQEDH